MSEFTGQCLAAAAMETLATDHTDLSPRSRVTDSIHSATECDMSSDVTEDYWQDDVKQETEDVRISTLLDSVY